ncbi:MAG TPA: alpha-hydroxy acid oxidase [Terriglobales bacterium]|nr:alpha-hydroxy acid oxidase [Terriglobales bacterium]
MSRTDRALGPPRTLNIADLRSLAKRRLPRVVFDYLDGGAECEITLQENCRAFRELTFRPRQAVRIGSPELGTEVLGQQISFPAILAPVGYSRVMHPAGEVAAAQAAGEAGTIFVLSTVSGHKLENVRAASQGPVWYQLYLLGGRAAAEAALERAQRAGFSALVVTIDTPIAGNRERDVRNGMRELLDRSLRAKLPFLWQFFSHPAWVLDFLRDGGIPKLENVVIPGKGPMPLIDVGAALADAVVTWEDLRWIRQVWPGPLVVKGVLTGEDARRAVDEGAAAVVVSNHGGRQLDGAPASLRVLPEVVAAVSDETEVLVDGGVRCGSDIVKALCLGARAVLIGRAYAYGLAAGGRAGVARALEILQEDVRRTMILLGCSSVSELNESYVNLPAKTRGGS